MALYRNIKQSVLRLLNVVGTPLFCVKVHLPLQGFFSLQYAKLQFDTPQVYSLIVLVVHQSYTMIY